MIEDVTGPRGDTIDVLLNGHIVKLLSKYLYLQNNAAFNLSQMSSLLQWVMINTEAQKHSSAGISGSEQYSVIKGPYINQLSPYSYREPFRRADRKPVNAREQEKSKGSSLMQLCEKNSGSCEKNKNKKARQASLPRLVLLSMDLFLECAPPICPKQE